MNMRADMVSTGQLPQQFRQSWAALRPGLPGHDDPQVDGQRAAAFAAADVHGLPSRRVEDWKFTSTGPLARLKPAAGAVPPLQELPDSLRAWPLDGACLRVFADGVLRPDLSRGDLPDGVDLRFLSQAPEGLAELLHPLQGGAEAAPANLNLALAAEGALIEVAPGAVPAVPLVLLHLDTASGGMHHLRHRVRCGAGAALTLVELHLPAGGERPGGEARWANLVTDVELARDAQLTHLRFGEGGHGYRTALLRGSLAAGAGYAGTALAMGGALARDEIELRLQGEHGSVRLDGLNLAGGRDHLDATLRVLHEAPHCRSSQHYRSVVDGQAHTVFQGRIRVAPGAQKSDAHQLSRALLLSDEAVADAKPELEILADDVQCSHGASIGDLDAQALFYLRARGIGVVAARQLLIDAFAAEVLDGIADAGWRAAAQASLAKRLHAIAWEQQA